jgi:hypothetical protein
MRRLFALVLLLAAASASAQSTAPKQSLRFGLRVGPAQWEALGQALKAEPAEAANPLGVTLALPAEWAKAPDWPALETAEKAVAAASARLIIATSLPGSAEDPATHAYLAALSEHAGGARDLALSVDWASLSETLKSNPDQFALAIKQLSASLRGKTEASVLLGEVSPEVFSALEPLYERELRAYVDGYTSTSTSATGGPDGEVVHFVESHHLGAPLLLQLPKVESPIGAQLLVLLSASDGVGLVDLETGNLAGVWHALLHLRSLLAPEMAAGFSVQATEVRDSNGPRADVGMLNFLDAEAMVQAVALVPVISKSPAGELQLKLPTGDVSTPYACPLPEGPRADLGYTADQKRGETVLRVPWQGKAQLLFFSRLKTGTVGQERLSVTGTYRIPVEIILARHQAVQQPQDVFLENYAAAAQVDYHFKLPGGAGSMDVTFKNSFFFQKGVGARWVQNQLLVNGVTWKGPTIPNLPIIEPEKVNTLPLALALNRDYSYRYVKDEPVDGHDCYVVEIIPVPGFKGSLYSGRVWIDKETYVRRKMSVRQTGLQDPQISNEETDFYTPVKGPEGRTYWLLTSMVGQQIFSVAGVNVAADREIRFTDLKVNDPGFGKEIAQIEAGDKPILQETQKGLRYLKKQKDGTRALEAEPKTGRWFAAAGAYYDPSLDYPLPLLGANYFDYDFKKSKTQVNFLLTGVVNTATVAKVNLFPHVDASADAYLFAIPFKDTFYVGGIEVPSEEVKILRERVDGDMGWRITEFSKLTLAFIGTYYKYSEASDTSSLFVLPKDHFDMAGRLTFSYARKGWSASAFYEAHHRSDWAPWGLAGAHADAESKRNYDQWEISANKAFYLPSFQKITLSATYMDGKDLDRYSQYQFTYLGRDQLSGFAGSGVRFDRGGILRLAYDFSLANVVRFGVRLDQARVQPLKGVNLYQNFTGASLTGAVTGPWQTYWTVDVGYALRSDVGPVKGNINAAIVVLKVW